METRAKSDESAARSDASFSPGRIGLRLGQGRVLFVDDDFLCRQTFERLLRARGIDVDVASSADEAIACARRHRYELIVCDLVMPRLDGVEVIQRLRAIQPDAHYVVTTGLDRQQAEAVVARTRVDGLMLKPWDAAELDATLSMHLTRPVRRATSEPPQQLPIAGDVLLVSDRGFDLSALEELVREALAHRGRVLWAKHPRDAALALSEHPVGLVVLEVATADAGALELLDHLREVGHEAPIIVIGSAVDEALAMQVVQAGAHEYVRKEELDVRALSRAARHAVERKRSELRLTRVALFDQLTGAANRPLFARRLEQVIADTRTRGGRFGLLFVDVDQFKEVNDQLGHQVGDALLSAFAMRLSDCLGPGDLLARLGGDEFAILSDQIDSHERAFALSRRITHALRAPFELDGHALTIGASVGIAVFPDDGQSDIELLRMADADMYRSKGHRRRARTSSVDGLTPVLGNEPLEHALRPALERGEFVTHLQPVLSLSTHEPELVEALLRWHRPEHGVLQACSFVSMLDDTGMIIPVGRYALGEGLRELAALREEHPGLRLSFNVTTSQVADRSFVDDTLAMLERHALPPSALELELSEAVLSARSEAVSEALARLSGCGVRLCVDDFGTGVSSLTLLRRAPVHAVKIDRSLVRELVPSIEARAAVSAIRTLGHGLGLQVVAEGVENDAQERILIDLGCDLAQGLYYAAPMPPEAMRIWLHT